MKLGIGQLVFVLLMLALLGSSYFFVFNRAAEKRLVRQTEVLTKKKALQDLRASTAGIPDIELKITELQNAIQFFESKLPQQRDIDKMLADVTSKAKEQQLQMKTFKTQKIERSAGYSELPIQMSMSGDFKSFYAFLLKLEDMKRITRLSQMKLEKITTKDGEMQANMTLSIFFESDGSNRLAITN
jgi:type IV pilus assembly protein PilO